MARLSKHQEDALRYMARYSHGVGDISGSMYIRTSDIGLRTAYKLRDLGYITIIPGACAYLTEAGWMRASVLGSDVGRVFDRAIRDAARLCGLWAQDRPGIPAHPAESALWAARGVELRAMYQRISSKTL